MCRRPASVFDSGLCVNTLRAPVKGMTKVFKSNELHEFTIRLLALICHSMSGVKIEIIRSVNLLKLNCSIVNRRQTYQITF